MKNFRFITPLFSLFCLFCLFCIDSQAKTPERAAYELIGRITPSHQNQFRTEYIERATSGNDVFEIDARDGKVVIRGNNAVAISTGYNWYLKYHCKANVSWFGDQLNLPSDLPLPAQSERREINGSTRVYFNYCTLSYTATWWDWERWQREIDLMAMNSINTPLQPIGLDAIWYYTLRDIGFSDIEARKFLVAPAHQAWQWMTNIESYGGPLPASWIESHVKLARRIFDRELELGMQPIQQSFTGYVPTALKKRYPNAKIAQQPEWYGFQGVSQLDPLDPLFATIGKAFLRNQEEIFGAYGLYAADPFHESEPPSADVDYLNKVGQTIYKITSDFDPSARIVMQSWSIREPIATMFPKDRLVVLCLNGARQDFWGYNFVVGNLHNFGGRLNMHGDLELLSSNQYAEAREKTDVAIGSGLFMESIEQNPAYYAMAFEMPLHKGAIDASSWLNEYATRNYGAESQKAQQAWQILLRSAYKRGTNGVENSSIVAARPAIDVKKSGPNAGFHIPYDPKQLIEAQGLLLEDCAQLGSSTLYRLDLIDIQRQIMSNLGQEIHKKVATAYKARDSEAFVVHASRFLAMLLDLDRLLATRTEWNFDRWVSDARRWGVGNKEKNLLEKDATALVTYWGFSEGFECKQFDYSWREWGGLIRRYHYPRWQMFYDMLAESLARGEPYYSEEGAKMNHGRQAFRANEFYDKLADWELNFADTPKRDLQPKATGDEVEITLQMYAKYSALAKEYYQ